MSSHHHAPTSVTSGENLGNPGKEAWMGPTASLVVLEETKLIAHSETRIPYSPAYIIQFNLIQWVFINVQA
jgi:hypothetical protein